MRLTLAEFVSNVMSIKFSKDDSRRIRKLEDSLQLLKDGTQTYFSITKLISIKSLCGSQDALRKYCMFLSAQVLKQPGKLPIRTTKKQVKLVFEKLAFDPVNTEIAEELLQSIKMSQNKFNKVGRNLVRTINSKEMLVLECLLKALMSPVGVAQSYVYDATRAYVETYNPEYGTGLIVDSIPMFEKVIRFWQRYEHDVLKKT